MGVSARNGEKAVDLAEIDIIVTHEIMDGGFRNDELIILVRMNAGGEVVALRSVEGCNAKELAQVKIKMHCCGIRIIRDCVKEMILTFAFFVHGYHTQSENFAPHAQPLSLL